MSEENECASEQNQSRREFVKKLAYAAPIILTLQAMPSLARAGSSNPGGGGGGKSLSERRAVKRARLKANRVKFQAKRTEKRAWLRDKRARLRDKRV